MLANVQKCRNEAYVDNIRPVGVGGGGRDNTPGAPPPPTFWAKIKKKEDYHFTVENTVLITQGNSPFDLKKKNILLGLLFIVSSHFQMSFLRAWIAK